MYLLKTC